MISAAWPPQKRRLWSAKWLPNEGVLLHYRHSQISRSSAHSGSVVGRRLGTNAHTSTRLSLRGRID